MARNKINVSSDLQNFTILHNEFIESELLTSSEKLVFIALKRHLNNERHDAFPSLNTICRYTRLTKPTVTKAIQGLKEKGIIKVEHRNDPKKGNQSNLYTVYDYKSVWKAGSKEEIASAIDEIEEKRYIDYLRAKGYKVEKEKEKEPESDTDQSTETDTFTKKYSKKDNNTQTGTRQEMYSLGEMKSYFDYEVMINDHPDDQDLIDYVMQIIYDTANSTSDTIRVQKTDKPRDVVIGALLKLSYEEILFVVHKYSEQKEKIKNPRAYILSQLYDAKGQYVAEMINDIQNHTLK